MKMYAFLLSSFISYCNLAPYEQWRFAPDMKIIVSEIENLIRILLYVNKFRSGWGITILSFERFSPPHFPR